MADAPEGEADLAAEQADGTEAGAPGELVAEGAERRRELVLEQANNPVSPRPVLDFSISGGAGGSSCSLKCEDRQLAAGAIAAGLGALVILKLDGSQLVEAATRFGVAAGVAGALTYFWMNNKVPTERAIRNALEERPTTGAYATNPEVEDICRGSLIVKLRCHTKEKLVQFLQDYDSGKVKQRLKDELLKIKFKEEVTVTILSWTAQSKKLRDVTPLQAIQSVAPSHGNRQVDVRYSHPDMEFASSPRTSMMANTSENVGFENKELVKVAEEYKGYIIGTAGHRIKKIKAKSGAAIDTCDEGFLVSGSAEQVECAKKDILQKVEEAVNRRSQEIVKVPEECRGYVIGTGGCSIKQIRANSGAFVSKCDEGFLVSGSTEQRECARKDILQKVEEIEGQRREASERFVEIPEGLEGFVIGKSGAKLNEISRKTGARLYFSGDEDAKEKARLEIKRVVNLAKITHENRMISCYFVDDFNLPNSCHVRLSETPCRLRPNEEYEAPGGEIAKNKAPWYLPDLQAKVLRCLQDIKKQSNPDEKVCCDMWSHFGTVFVVKAPKEDLYKEWTLQEATAKLAATPSNTESQIRQPVWRGKFEGCVNNINERHLERFLQKPAYDTRHDLSFMTPSSLEVRCKVWVKGCKGGEDEIPFDDFKNVLNEFRFKDKRTDERCKGWLCLPSIKRLRADITFPACDFDCRISIRRREVFAEDVSPTVKEELLILTEYLSHMTLQEDELLLPAIPLPSDFDMEYRRSSKRASYRHNEDFTAIVSKEISYPSKTQTSTEKKTDLHLHCNKWDSLLRSGLWQPEDVVEKLPEFMEFVKMMHLLISRAHLGSEQHVPPEIRSRGAEASLAYRMALLEGKVQVRRTRLMLIGQDRAGKTSLKKTLLRLPFDPAEPSTDGVEVDRSKLEIEVDKVKGSNWKLIREQDSTENQCDRRVAKMVAQTLLASHDEGKKEMGDLFQLPTEQTDMGEETSAAYDATDIDATEAATEGGQHINVNQPKDSDESDVPDRREPTPAGSQMQETIPENIASLVTTHLTDSDSVAESETNEIVLDVWDFAGQHLYYASHPFFFTPRAIYLLVYNLSKDLNSRAEPCVRQGTHDTVLDNLSNETNLDTLLSWLVSVHSMRRAATKLDEDEASELSEEESPDHDSPPVILVGTHADKVRPEDITKSQELIEKKMAGKAFEKHVIGGRFAVDNTQGAGAEGLKGKVEEVLESEPYMKEWLPVKWFNFEKTVKSIDGLNMEHHVTQERVRELAQSECFIQDDIQLETMLNFFHDLGVIVRHRNTVVLQSRWLIDLFKKLITIRPYPDQGPKYREFWKKLENEGILHQKLIDRAFRDLAPGENDTKEDMLAMMEEYGLIAKFPLITESSKKGAPCYFVPAHLKTSPPLSEVKPREGDPCVLLIHFLHGFVPHGLFPQLVSRLIQWCPKVGCTHQPNLYFNAVRCIVGNEAAHFDLILSCSQRLIKVVLRSPVAEELANVTRVTMGTIPKEVHTFLRDTLQCLKQECYWLGSMEYEMGVHCLACQKCSEPCGLHRAVSCPDDDCFHCVPVEIESCPRQPLVCPKTLGDNSRFTVPGLESWYNEEHPKENVDDTEASSKMNPKVWKEGTPTVEELDNVARNVVDCWQPLGRQLGVPQSGIDNIQLDNLNFIFPTQKAFRMLQVWCDKGSSSTYAQLAKALCVVEKESIAETYCQSLSDK